MKYIAILFMFISLLMLSNIATSNSIFESYFIKIDIKTNNAYETKLKSIEEIKIKSLLFIVSKILDERNKNKFIEILDKNKFINELIQNIIIENELITSNKYIAEIKVHFHQKEI